ncbi:MAG: outer membrane beta-barrel protein [Polaribacter sp.]|uniref:outer membrane beta-barrel protein n=1 Tax=Polaribacter sp. TaxID=1920175 RepID=UPI003BB027E1
MKKIIFTLLLASSLLVNAQEDEKKFSLSGSIDTYFRGNLSGGAFNSAPGSSFANQAGFALGMINVIAAYEGEKVGFVADMVYGPRGTDAVFGSTTASSQIVNQLYAYWNVSDKVKITVGNFNTFLGYEVISPTGNFNYSTSYLFSYGPFSHSGIKADFSLGGDTTLMLAVMNPTDATDFNPTGSYALGAQLGFSGQFLNLLYDPNFFEVDYTGGFDVSEKLFLGINAAYNSGNDGAPGFYGAALYPQLATSDSFKIGLRGEYFKEDGAFGAIGAAGADASVFATTLTGNYTIGALTIIPEIRIDTASEGVYSGDKALSSFVLAAVYAF